MAFNWFKKSDPLAGVDGPKGKRTKDGKASPKGWTDNRAAEAAAPLKQPPPDGPHGFSAGGKSRRGKPKQS